MGFLRGAAVTILAIVLLISLFVMNASLTLTWSLEYETLKPVLKDTVQSFAEENFELDAYLDETIFLMQAYCLNETEFVFNQGGYTFVVPCEVVYAGSAAVLDYGLDSLIEELYYAEYECDFWECVKTADNFLVLVSEKSHDYWQSKFYVFLLTSIALFILMFIVSNRKSNVFILGGILTIISSIPFVKLTWISIFLPEQVKEIFLSFFARSHNVFLIMLIVGFFLLGLGIVFHFLKWGLKISKLFKKHSEEQEQEDDVSKEDVKKIVKKEIVKNEVKQVVEKELSSVSTQLVKRKKEIVKDKKPVVTNKSKIVEPAMKSNKNKLFKKVSKPE